MQPADNSDLVLNFFTLVVMPLIILGNLPGVVRNSPFHTYLWRENPLLMRVTLVMLGGIAAFSAISLSGHYGLISPAVKEMLSMLVGVPFLFLSIATIVLVGIAAVRVLRDWRAGRLCT